MNPTNQNSLASFWEHLEELRQIIIKIFFIWIFGTLVTFYFSDSINYFLSSQIPDPSMVEDSLKKEKLIKVRITNNGLNPQEFQIPHSNKITWIEPNESIHYWSKEKEPNQLLLLSPFEGITTTLKLAFWAAVALTSPLCFYYLFLFFKPALKENEYRIILPFFCLSLFFLALSGGFCYAITLPLANQYFVNFNQNIGVNAWSYHHYINYCLMLFFGNIIAFESAALFFFLVHFGIVTEEFMKKNRRISLVIFLILGAILTPPDIITQLVLAFPLMFFYEIGIIYARFRKRQVRALFLN